MTKVKITVKEAAIIRAIIAIEKSGKTSFNIDEMCEKVYSAGGLKKPKWWRTSMTGSLKDLAFKLEQIGGFRLRRISGLGAGQLGEYEFAGDFAKLLRKEEASALL